MKCICHEEHSAGACRLVPVGKDGSLYLPPKKPVVAEPIVEVEPIVEPEPAQSPLIWTEAPEGFEFGHVTKVVSDGRILIRADDDGQMIFAGPKDAILPGAHLCVVTPGMPCIFSRFTDEHGVTAINVNLNVNNIHVEEVEISAVVANYGTWLLAERPCSCRIVIPAFEFKGGMPPVGSVISHRHIAIENRVYGTAVEVLAEAGVPWKGRLAEFRKLMDVQEGGVQ